MQIHTSKTSGTPEWIKKSVARQKEQKRREHEKLIKHDRDQAQIFRSRGNIILLGGIQDAEFVEIT